MLAFETGSGLQCSHRVSCESIVDFLKNETYLDAPIFKVLTELEDKSYAITETNRSR